LKKQIEGHMRTIEVLRDALSSNAVSRPHGRNHPVQPASDDPIDGLLQLGESMIEHETVPDLEETTSRAQQEDIHHEGRHSQVPELRTPSRHDSAIIIPEAPVQPTEQPLGHSFTTFTHLISGDRPPMPSHLPPSTIRTAESDSTERSAVSNAFDGSIDSCQEGEIISRNLQRDNGDDNNYMSVEPLSHIIHLSRPESFSAVDGYIIDGRRSRFVAAGLWKNTEKNLISQAYAELCGLDVTPLVRYEGKDSLVEFWNGTTVEWVGTTIVRWSADRSNTNSFTTPCLVCDLWERAPQIIFGGPFVSKRAYYENQG
jgi:hypothetical protein